MSAMAYRRMGVRHEMARGVVGTVILLLLVAVAQGKDEMRPAAAKAAAKQIYPPSSEHIGPAWFEDFAGKVGIRVLNANGGTVLV